MLKKALSTIHEPLIIAIKLILIISILSSINNHLWHTMSINILLLILLFIPQIMNKSYKLIFPKEFEILLLMFIIANLFIGSINGKLVQIFFGIAIGFVGFIILLILYSNNQIKKNYFLIILFTFCFTMTFGVVLELLKYYLKLLLNHSLSTSHFQFAMQNLTYVALGAIIASLLGLIYMKGHTGILSPLVEKLKILNPKLFKEKNNSKEILKLISKGESSTTEFKQTLRINLHTNEKDKKIEHSAMKTIAAFLNSNGGTLFIGISDDKKIIGLKKDNFSNSDKLLLHLTNLIKQQIGKKHVHLIDFKLIRLKDKEILKIDCKKSTSQIFLKINKEEEFYIRVGPSSAQIKGSELIDYIKKRFETK